MKKANYITAFVFIVASVQLLITASARADSKILEKLDLDKDGQITIKEAVSAPAILASFGKIDKDGNGKISLIELNNSKVAQTKEKYFDKFE
jgi:Ca2+-binding EF-hand superfamily protein